MLERAAREGTPLIDGDVVTFVWQGNEPPRLLGDFGAGLWSECELRLVEVEDGVWSTSTRLPVDAYVEYVFLRSGWRVPDPFNPREVSNGLGGANNYFYMPRGAPTPLAERGADVPRGILKRHTLQGGQFVMGDERPVFLYQPATEERVPLIVVFDGEEYRRRARLHVIVENLIAQGRIRPVALALVNHGGTARLAEYACNDGTVAFVTETLLPFAREHLRLLDPAEHPGAFGVLGASMGGLMSLYTALRAPDIFGHAICQSSTLVSSVFGRDPVVFELARQVGPQPPKVWMDAGTLETVIASNRRMHETLLASGHAATFHAYNGGHNYSAWRDDVWRGLEALYGQPVGLTAHEPTLTSGHADGDADGDAQGQKTLIARIRGGQRRPVRAREDGPNATGD